MALDIDNTSKQLKKINNKQLKLFTTTLRKNLINSGFDKKTIDEALKQSARELKELSTFEKDCDNLFNKQCKDLRKENRGIDAIGRILIEYCFFRTPKTQMIWPDNSAQDQAAREGFVKGVIPRPLMRYFLVSVRGTIPEINKFEASSVLFGEENKAHEDRKVYVDELVKEFDDGNDNTKNKWNAIYSDERFQKIALDLVGDIRRKIEQFGLERYLRILENLRQRDPDRKGLNAMKRPFTLEDAKQIDETLWAAEGTLAKSQE